MTKVKVPKRIAGVKVPKKLRKQAKKMLKASASPVVQDLALAGLTLAATRMLESAAAARATAGAQPASARPDKPEKGRLHGLDLGAMLEAAVAEGAKRFLDGFQAKAPAAKPTAKPAPTRTPAEGKRAKPAPAAAASPKRRSPGAAKQS